MAKNTIEQRVAALEKEVESLRAALANGASGKDWRSTLGMFTGDEVMKRIDEAALRFREEDRRKARRRRTKKQLAQS